MNEKVNTNKDGATRFYETNKKNKIESVSGVGSFQRATVEIVRWLPRVFSKYSISSVLDCPCGDFNWMKNVNLSNVNYLGLDIVQEIVDNNNRLYSNPNIRFEQHDIISKAPPKADLVICRDLLFHLTNDQQVSVINNFRAANIKYIITTTYPWVAANNDLTDEERAAQWGFRQINVELPPISLGSPIEILKENQYCQNRNQRMYKLKTDGLMKE
jgi:hypothetical protein